MNTQRPVGSGDGEETVPGMGSSAGDGSQVPLPGRRTVAGMVDGMRTRDNWSEDERSLPGRERHGIQGIYPQMKNEGGRSLAR